MHGVPHFAISIGLEHDGNITSGIIYDPIKDEFDYGDDIKIEENKDDKELLLENISIENATYLQNQEQDKEVPNFEVESIELATPELFANQKNTDDMNQDQSSDMQVFEDYKNENNSETITEAKDPEMFENLDDEKDFEIPAFLRRQKN